MNKLYLGATALVSAVVLAISSSVAMAKGGTDNPASVLIDESGNTVKIDQSGNNNNVDANITNDSSNPVPVTVQNPPTPSVATDHQFVGYTEQQTDGAAGGYSGMNSICQNEFGESARMCTTKEWLNTHGSRQLALGDFAWVQPHLVSQVFIPTPFKTAHTDWSGLHLLRDPFAPPHLFFSCEQWINGTDSADGLVVQQIDHVDIHGDRVWSEPCDNVHRVTCCAPD